MTSNEIVKHEKEALVQNQEITDLQNRLDKLTIAPLLMATTGSEGCKLLTDKANELKNAIKNASLRETAFDEILGEIVEGACLNRTIVYCTQLNNKNITPENLELLLKIRQTADIHLLKILKAINSLKNPVQNLTVKKANQVNVADRINQAEKQVNVN
jgi:hypothetical protein